MDGAVAEQRFPLGIRPDGEMTRKGVLCAFVLGTLAVFSVFPLGVLGIALSNMGMNRVGTKPDLARKLVTWSWATFIVADAVGLFILLSVLLSR